MSAATIPAEERKDMHEQALEEATRSVAVMFRPSDVVEVRVPKAGRNRTISGYFNDSAALVDAIREMDGKGPGVYVTLNPVKPELLARASNRVKPFVETTTSDADIVLRRWMLVDCDPVRPAGISSSRQELEAALDVAEKVREHLRGRHWPEPVFCLSGNGFHLLYRLPDLANHDASTSLISRSLKALSARFSSATVHIDETVFNAARISKAYGTLARKGDHTPERPYRLSRMLDIPDPVAPVSVELLEQLACEAPESRNGTTSMQATMKVFEFDVEAWMAKVGIVVEKGPGGYRGGRRWTLRPPLRQRPHRWQRRHLRERRRRARLQVPAQLLRRQGLGRRPPPPGPRVCCPGAMAGRAQTGRPRPPKGTPRSASPRR